MTNQLKLPESASNMQRARGFTVMEAIIVVAIASVLLAIGLIALRQTTRTSQREVAQISQVQAFKSLYDAAQRYTATRGPSQPDSTAELPIASLLAADLLLPGWEGAYSPGAGLTPLGQRYAVYVNRHPDGVNVAITVTVVDAASPSALARWDIRGLDGLKRWNVELAQNYRTRFGEEVWLLEPVAAGDAPQVWALSLSGEPQAFSSVSQDQMPTPATMAGSAPAISSRWSNQGTERVAAPRKYVDDPSTCDLVEAPSGTATCPVGKQQVVLVPDTNCRYTDALTVVGSPAGGVQIETVEYLVGADSSKCARSCDPSVVPGCDAGPGGTGLANQTAGNTWSCPLVERTEALQSDKKYQAQQTPAGLYRVETTGGYVRHYVDRVLRDRYVLGTRVLAERTCLEDRWVSPVSGSTPTLTAGTLGERSTSGRPPMTLALCCVTR